MDKPQDLRLENFTCMQIIGGSHCRKSTLSLKIALNHEKVYKTPHAKVVYFFKYSRDAFEQAKAVRDDLIFLSEIDQLEQELSENVDTLLILDDFLSTSQSQKRFLSELFLDRSHNARISVIFQTQLLFIEHGRDWTNNTQYFVFFKNQFDSQIRYFFRRIGQRKFDFLYDVYTYCTDENPYGVFFMSMHPRTEKFLRYRNFVLPEQGNLVFVPKT